MKSFSFFITSKKILKQKRLRTCFILIALVVAPVICALSFSESMMQGIADKYIYLSGGHIQLFSGSIPEDAQVYIESTSESVQGNCMIYSSDGYSPLIVKGVEESYFNNDRLQFIELTVDESRKDNGIIISEVTAKRLGLEIGDKAAMMIIPDTSEAVLRPVLVTVGGIYRTGYEAFDEVFSFGNYNYCSKLFTSEGSSYTEILLKKQYADSIQKIEDYFKGTKYSTFADTNSLMYSNFVTSRQMITIILLVVIVVAAFFTASVAQQFVQDDIEETAILKLTGATDRQIQNNCFLCVFSVTISGIVAGFAGGILISYLFKPVLKLLSKSSISTFSYYLLDFDVFIPYGSVSLILVCLILISAVSIRLSLLRTRRITPLQLFNQK